MAIRNYEFKARVTNQESLEEKLLKLKPLYKGEDRQTDTYFNTPAGRLKLREGNIENALIFYRRPDIKGSKQSDVIILNLDPSDKLKEILTQSLGVKVVVEKTRRIYYIGIVKFHFDLVKGLGTFVEVEVIDESAKISSDELKDKCRFYLEYFGIDESALVDVSYSDLLFSEG